MEEMKSLLPLLLPKAVAWAEQQSEIIAGVGKPLDDALATLAKRVGVQHPELVRIHEVACIPVPSDPTLASAAGHIRLFGGQTAGLTLGYGIFIRSGYLIKMILAHEFRHVYQYEQEGSIASFLSTYLQQTAAFGYSNAPYETDARAFEIT